MRSGFVAESGELMMAAASGMASSSVERRGVLDPSSKKDFKELFK